MWNFFHVYFSNGLWPCINPSFLWMDTFSMSVPFPSLFPTGLSRSKCWVNNSFPWKMHTPFYSKFLQKHKEEPQVSELLPLFFQTSAIKVVRKQRLILIWSVLSSSLAWKRWMCMGWSVAYVGRKTVKTTFLNNALTRETWSCTFPGSCQDISVNRSSR